VSLKSNFPTFYSQQFIRKYSRTMNKLSSTPGGKKTFTQNNTYTLSQDIRWKFDKTDFKSELTRYFPKCPVKSKSFSGIHCSRRSYATTEMAWGRGEIIYKVNPLKDGRINTILGLFNLPYI
jgi:hypothetical protein